MAQSGHDPLAWRLAAILLKLNRGEHLEVSSLAEEFGVHTRTIQRDLQDRFAFLPLEKNNGKYTLESTYLGRITYNDIENFARLAGLNGLFAGLSTQFVRELLDARLQDTLLIHGHNYETLHHRQNDFQALQAAIQNSRQARFTYQNQKTGRKKTTRMVAPYRLINHDGVWYLLATENGKPKTYAFSKIGGLEILDEAYVPDPDVLALLDQDDSIWIKEQKTEVVLSVAPMAAIYFRRRKLISQQTIVKELENGGLIVSGKFAHPDQILPIVRYWLPHIRIIDPVDWQADMEQELRVYLNHPPAPPSA